MKSVFVDTNIIIDLIADRKPFSKFAIEIFGKAEKKQVKLFTSSHAIATTHYILKKYLDEQSLRDVLYNLTDYLEVVSVDEGTIKKSLKSKHKDFEDAIQVFCAHKVEAIDFIVTRNIKDFRLSEIPVFSPDEIIEKI